MSTIQPFKRNTSIPVDKIKWFTESNASIIGPNPEEELFGGLKLLKESLTDFILDCEFNFLSLVIYDVKECEEKKRVYEE